MLEKGTEKINVMYALNIKKRKDPLYTCRVLM